MRRIIAIVKAPRSVPKLIAYSRFVAQRIAAEPLLPSPSPPLAVFQTHIDELEAAEIVVKSVRNTATARDAKRAAVKSDLTSLCIYVGSAANQNLTTAVALIEVAGFHVKLSSGHTKPLFKVIQAENSGGVILRAKANRAYRMYYWAYSLDGVTWIEAPQTTDSETTISGFVRGTRVFFRFRAFTKAGYTDWCDAIAFIVA